MALNPAAAPHKPQDLARRVAALERKLAAMSSGPNYQVNGQAFRLAQQASQDAYDAALTTGVVYGEIGSTTFSASTWTRYDLATIEVPDGFSRLNVILFTAAGVTLTAAGNVGVQPVMWIDPDDLPGAGSVTGPAIDNGTPGGGPVSVSSALAWLQPTGLPAGMPIHFGAYAVRVGAAQSGSCNVHAAGQVVFQR